MIDCHFSEIIGDHPVATRRVERRFRFLSFLSVDGSHGEQEADQQKAIKESAAEAKRASAKKKKDSQKMSVFFTSPDEVEILLAGEWVRFKKA